MSENLDSTRQRAGVKEQVAQGYRLFAMLGWGDMGDGHISGRDPIEQDCFWLLDAQVPFSQATPEHLVMVNPNGEAASGSGKPSLPAYHIHYPILATRPELVSVAHTHTFWGTPFSAEARTFEPITQESCVFVDDHALFDDEMVQIQDLDAGYRIANSLAKNRGVILRNHGLLTVGKSVMESVTWFIMMERVAEAHLKVNNPKPISQNAALYAKADLISDEQVEHAFMNLLAHYGVTLKS